MHVDESKLPHAAIAKLDSDTRVTSSMPLGFARETRGDIFPHYYHQHDRPDALFQPVHEAA